MASDNTISESLPHASIPESDNTISELLARTSISRSDETVFELIPRTSTTRSGKTYGFFQTLPLEQMSSFPREIRDQIHDLIFQEREEVVKGWHYKIRTTSPKARLILRRFTKEYDERPVINNQLEVSECVLARWDCPCLDVERPFPSLAARTTAVHINLIFCSDGPQDACIDEEEFDGRQGSWIMDLIIKLPLVQKVELSVSCGNSRCATAVQSTHDFWSHIPQVSRVVLLTTTREACVYANAVGEAEDFRRDKIEPPHSAEFFEGRETMATWTRSHGWQTDALMIGINRIREACEVMLERVISSTLLEDYDDYEWPGGMTAPGQ